MIERASAASASVQVEPEESHEVLRLPKGESVTLENGGIALRDAEGRVLVRYADGVAEVVSPKGDLILAAPAGRVVLRSGLDVEIEAARDVVQHASRKVSISAGADRGRPAVAVEGDRVSVSTHTLEAQAVESRLVTGKATVIAQHIATLAKHAATTVDRWELRATRMVHAARDAFVDVTDLAQSRLGRARVLVKGAYTLRARRAMVASKEETKVDGKKVLLG